MLVRVLVPPTQTHNHTWYDEIGTPTPTSISTTTVTVEAPTHPRASNSKLRLTLECLQDAPAADRQRHWAETRVPVLLTAYRVPGGNSLNRTSGFHGGIRAFRSIKVLCLGFADGVA